VHILKEQSTKEKTVVLKTA